MHIEKHNLPSNNLTILVY